MRTKASRGTGQHFESLDGRRLFAGTLTLSGTSGADEIYVYLSGSNLQVSVNDVVTNYASSSVSGISISGGNGDDDLEVSVAVTQPVTISGGNGSDIVFGGAGNDTLYGDAGQDYIRGKNGNDYIDAGGNLNASYQLSYGDNGSDTIYGGRDDDKMYGGTGSDYLYGSLGVNVYCGNDGDNNDDGAPDYYFHTASETYGAVYGQPNDQNIW